MFPEFHCAAPGLGADEGRMGWNKKPGNDIVRSPKLPSVVRGGGDGGGGGSYNEWSSLEANKAIVSFSVLPPSLLAPSLSLFHLWHDT